jgi:hypothetical protein
MREENQPQKIAKCCASKTIGRSLGNKVMLTFEMKLGSIKQVISRLINPSRRAKRKIPIIDNRFICISDISNTELCAVISSYFLRKGYYFPVFIFPDVNTRYGEKHESDSDGYISAMIGNETSVLIGNSISRMTGCNYVIYAGLSEYQKSYMDKYNFEVIDIQNIDEVEDKLKKYIPIPKKTIRCRVTQTLEGLAVAVGSRARLVIDEQADEIIPEKSGNSDGLILVEKNTNYGVTSVIGLNYAASLGADIHIAESFDKNERGEIEEVINEWSRSRDEVLFTRVSQEIEKRIVGIDFKKYQFATFFTNGLPYSLHLKNVIPFTYVNLSIRPDLFVCNSIGWETGDRFHSAVIFSPEFFKEEISGEETETVKNELDTQKYYVRLLLGNDATARNLDFHAQHFPYDIMHICSHGGVADGYEVTEKFKDRDGNEHTVVYDEVVSFAVVGGEKPIEVIRKTSFVSFDGHKWMSKELREQNYPNYVFKDMFKAMSLENDTKNAAPRNPKKNIPLANVIFTIDGFHQGMFRILSSHHSPIVFNNSCFSWGETSRFFISSGARGYIGTLWGIENDAAVKVGKSFYSAVKNNSVMTSLFNGLKEIKHTDSEDIYVYWGLHFTSISSQGVSFENSRERVFKELMRAFVSWIKHVRELEDGEVRRNSIRVVNDLHRELVTNFSEDVIRKLSGKTRDIGQIIPEEVMQAGSKETHKPINQAESEQRFKTHRQKQKSK